jgi:RHS repeat-associated protein
VLAGNLAENPYAFTGQRLDPESDLYHFHFRKYDAEVGVWATADPIGILGGVNLYQYVESNPINFNDWLGLVCGSTGSDWIVPDKPGGFDFVSSCQNHDNCYANQGGFEQCNKDFRQDMDNVCNTYPTRSQTSPSPYKDLPYQETQETCDWWAATYESAVSGDIGKGAYNNAGMAAAQTANQNNTTGYANEGEYAGL